MQPAGYFFIIQLSNSRPKESGAITKFSTKASFFQSQPAILPKITSALLASLIHACYNPI